MERTKKCKSCRKEKSLNDFWSFRGKYLQARCKECKMLQAKEVIICECGKITTVSHKARHLNSKFHQDQLYFLSPLP